MDSVVKFLDRALSAAAVLVFVLLTLDVLLGIGSRYLMGGQVSWTVELATFLLVWLVFLGSSLAYCDDAHLRIDLLLQNLDPDARQLAYRLSHGIILVFALVVLTWGGYWLVADRWESGQTMPTLGIRRAWLYAAIPINGFFMTLIALHKVLRGQIVAELGESENSTLREETDPT